MIVFNVRRMSKSSEVDGVGTIAVARSTYALAKVSPVEVGGGGTTPEDSSLGCLESHMSNPLPKKGGTYGNYYVYGRRSEKVI